MKLSSSFLVTGDVLCYQGKDEFATSPTCTCSEACARSSAALSYRYILQWQPFQSAMRVGVITGPWLLL